MTLLNTKNFATWKGFPAGFNAGQLTIKHTTQTHSGLENMVVQQLFFSMPGYAELLELYLFEEKPLKLTINFPELEDSASLLDKLGIARYFRDFYLDMSLIKDGEYIYPEKGIALQADNRNESDIMYRITLFDPCIMDFYLSHIATAILPAEEF